MTNRKQKKGFTLIELLVVIAIIGILSAIGLVSLNGAREKARDSKRKSDVASIRVAMELYKDDQPLSKYPANTAGGVPAVISAELTTPLVPNYMPILPVLPAGGSAAGGVNDYWYISNSAAIGTQYAINQAFALLTRLEGGAKNWYVLNNVGGVEVANTIGAATNPAAANTKCDASAVGVGQIHACLNTPTST
jgi:general secretion pathway protein G